jgi:hypothetical protein
MLFFGVVPAQAETQVDEDGTLIVIVHQKKKNNKESETCTSCDTR